VDFAQFAHGAVFYFLAAVTLASGLVVARARNLVYSAVALLFTFFGVAGLFVYAHADFVAGIQAVVYIGGILVLILFGIMLTRREGGVKVPNEVTGSLGARLIPIGITALLLVVVLSVDWQKEHRFDGQKDPRMWPAVEMEGARPGDSASANDEAAANKPSASSSETPSSGSEDSSWGTIDTIGQSMMNKYLIAFEEISVLLLIALLGAVYLARRPTEEELEEAQAAHEELEKEVFGPS